MDVLQQALTQALTSLPELFLEKLIAKKLQDQGITAPKSLVAKLAKHVRSGNTAPFRYKGKTQSGHVSLAFHEADADEISQKMDAFYEEQLPKVCRDVAGRMSKTILRYLKSQWAEEQALQESDLAGFRERLEGRWGKPLGQLRMLLTMAREWGQWTFDRQKSLKSTGKAILRDILTRQHVRACQVTDEILCLLENGFADGAMARWRTLHEIAVVAAVISRHGEDIAQRYLAHQAVESKRAMSKYLDCCAQLGYRALPAREVRKVQKAYDAAIVKYGEGFKTDYGWAAEHLKKKRPTFADLEAEAGRAEMRSHYQMGNDNVHAGIKSMYVRLGLVGNYDGLLSGRSNGGFMEPGQNAANTLTQISIIACSSEPNLDDLVVAEMMRMLRDDIPHSFHAADKQLRRDDKSYRATETAG
jgi:hypothetical protein